MRLSAIERLQADFMQQQLAIANAQTQDLFKLSAKIAMETLETVNAAATKTFEQLGKTA